MAVTDREVDGFVFATAADAQIAREELKKIQYINEKLNYEEPENVLTIYNKMIENRMFVTPIGYAYLREIQLFLYRNTEIADDRINDITLFSVFGTRAGEAARLDAIYVKPKEKKDYHKQFVSAVWVCIALSVLILSMFYITVKSPNPNVLNYENALVNRYSEWEEELTQRENVIREKEAQLQIESPQQD